MTEEARQLARLTTIDEIIPIPDADAIEAARIGGWTVVTRKGEFKAGDKCVYFEIDSLLPLSDERFEFLRPRGVTQFENGEDAHRLKTARLRGVYSQGLALPAAEFERETSDRMASIQDLLGIVKYEPPLPTNSGNIVGPFPRGIRKTDAERAQNLALYWDQLASRKDWVATEKIDGTSVTFWMDDDGNRHVASRNWEIGEGDNMYWRIARDAEVFDFLRFGEALQGELFGEGIQKNPLGIKGQKLAVFGYFDEGLEIPLTSPSAYKPQNEHSILAPVYEDLELPDTVEAAVQQADGIKSLVSPGRLAEGIVWHNQLRESENVLEYSSGFSELGGRTCLKVISNKWLLKHDG